MDRIATTLGRSWDWVPPLVQRYVELTSGKTRPRQRDVIEFLRSDEALQRAWSEHYHALRIQQWLTEPTQMQPVAAARDWDMPTIESVGDLAQWLWLDPEHLEWFADLKDLGNRSGVGKLAHYNYKILRKRSGSVRLIEAPKPHLKKLQKQILTWILERIPPHPNVHGFVKGRSIKTFAAPHAGRRVVLRMDLQDFFPSFRAARIQALFGTLGYPEAVANRLAGICTNAVPSEIWRHSPPGLEWSELRQVRTLYARPHLPQGASTSPALANLCAYRLDCRLTGLAKSAAATYTRYADDLAFSGGADFDQHVDRFADHVAAILLDEGFHVQHRKTRIMRQGVRQHLVSLVINQHANVNRNEFDRLKATLTNCVRHGPDSQNRDAHSAFRSHLEGRVSFVESINPLKGQRLRQILTRIQWDD